MPKIQNFYGFLRLFIRPKLGTFIGIQLCILTWSLDQILWPFILKLIIDGIQGISSQREEVWSILSLPIALGLGFWFLSEMIYRIGAIYLAKLLPEIEADVRTSMFGYIQRHSQNFFNRFQIGNIGNRINEMSKSISEVLYEVITLFIPTFTTILIAIALFSWIQPMFGLLLVIWLLLQLALGWHQAKLCDQKATDHANERSEVSGKIFDSLSNIFAVRIFSKHDYELSRIEEAQTLERQKRKIALMQMEKMKILMSLVTLFGAIIGINGFMIYSWQKGSIQTGDVAFIFTTTWNIITMSWSALLQIPQLLQDIGTCRAALKFLQIPHEIVEIDTPRPLKVSKGVIRFDNVVFSYNQKNPSLLIDQLTIYPGEKIGIVGLSGSGKTTFFNLLMRVYDPQSGKITIDGIGINELSLYDLHSHITMIPQDPPLFHRTIRDNILYGNEELGEEMLLRAARVAQCEEFVNKLPEGYDTLVGEKGSKLSGGQRQRIAIARALIKDPPILVFDEATSALDSMTENELQDTLKELIKNKTALIAAHRLSTLSLVDRILVFSNGQIIEDGSHEALITLDGVYASLWKHQLLENKKVNKKSGNA